jgi:hypothetical protein
MLRLASFVAAGLFLTGCFTVNADLPGTLRSDLAADDAETVGRFDVQKGHNFLLWGLVNQPPPDFISTELKREVKSKNGDGVRNLEVHSEFGCTDIVLSRVTCGILAPRTFRFTGDVVRIRKGPLSGGAPATTDAPPAALETPPPAVSY